VITFPDFRFVETPRTGSRTLVNALQTAGGEKSKTHHDRVEDIPLDRPVYSVIRDPYDHLESWYFHMLGAPKGSANTWPGAPDGTAFLEYLLWWRNDPLFPTLNPYKDVVTKVFFFSDGIDSIFQQMVQWDGAPLPNTHGPREVIHQWSVEEIEVAQDRFAPEFEYWQKCLIDAGREVIRIIVEG